MSPSKRAATAFLALGSNLGDRRGLLLQAALLLDADPLTRVAAVSSLYATEPVGMAGAPGFLNAAVEVRTSRGPGDLLDLCLGIESGLGRVRTGGWTPRTIDIDVLLYGGLRLATARLTLPHPRMKERAFVLVPLAEIAPLVRVEGRTLAALALAAGSSGVVRCADQSGWPPPFRLRAARPA